MNMHLFCIGHKQPAFNPPLSFVHVSPVQVPTLNQIIIEDNAFGDLMHGSIISEYAQLFGLAKVLELRPPEELLYLFQYRKFLSFRKGDAIASNIPYAYPVNALNAESFFPTLGELQHFNSQYLVGTYIVLNSMHDNYSRSHIEKDFLNFSHALAEHPDFGLDRARLFSNCNIMFPSPAIGIVPQGMFCQQMKLLMEVWSIFAKQFYVPRSGYQRRVGGFLLERLHSFLLYELFFPVIKAPVIQGHQMIISDSLLVSTG